MPQMELLRIGSSAQIAKDTGFEGADSGTRKSPASRHVTTKNELLVKVPCPGLIQEPHRDPPVMVIVEQNSPRLLQTRYLSRIPLAVGKKPCIS